MRIFPWVLCVAVLGGCSRRPMEAFQQDLVPAAPDYARTDAWAALPLTLDSADVVPDLTLADHQEMAAVDVFYVYPTTYVGKRGERKWNASIQNDRLNVRTDKLALRNQATVFNGSCQVYAPRYRQAHLNAFYTRKRKVDAEQALGLAYRDVRAAFVYYLEHFNHGRPIVIAGHSQGTLHAARLMKEFYDDRLEAPPLVAAYLVGMPVRKDYFTTIRPCSSPEETHCFCSWRTVNERYRPGRVYPTGDEYLVTNPLTWSLDQPQASREKHDGAVLNHFYKGLYPHLIDARADDGLLRVTTPKIPGIPILVMRNYHVADYNLFYANIRENVSARVAAWLAQGGNQATE